MKKACTVFWLTAALSAQAFIVDGSNGPGAQFTDIQSAIDNVADGGVLLIRPGTYPAFQLDGRSMALLADPGVAVDGHVLVANTAAHQAVTLRGFDFTGIGVVAQAPFSLQVSGCAGPVWLENISSVSNYCIPPPIPLFSTCLRPIGLRASSNQQLQLRDCSIRESQFINCTTHVSGGVMSPVHGWFEAPHASRGMEVVDGSMQISGPIVVTGGMGVSGFGVHTVGRAALNASNAHIRVFDGSFTAGVGSLFLVGEEAIRLESGATLEVAHRVTLWPVSSQLRTAMPNLDSTSVAIGSASAATVTTEPGDLVILVFGLPGAPTVVPGVAHPLWIDSSAYLFHTLAVQQGTSPVTGSIAVPNDPLFRGFSIAWQAVVSSPGMPLQVTNPSVNLIR